ncbi:MAG: hypothetical protein IKS32_13820 [Solobacterium sp.]|nr:hypothetical protein [Solobacterium sp.]
MSGEKVILDQVMKFVNGGTEQETKEMYSYIHRKFPEFDNLPREDAIATALIVYLPIDKVLFNTINPEAENSFTTRDGRQIGHEQVMAMLREKYGD